MQQIPHRYPFLTLPGTPGHELLRDVGSQLPKAALHNNNALSVESVEAATSIIPPEDVPQYVGTLALSAARSLSAAVVADAVVQPNWDSPMQKVVKEYGLPADNLHDSLMVRPSPIVHLTRPRQFYLPREVDYIRNSNNGYRMAAGELIVHEQGDEEDPVQDLALAGDAWLMESSANQHLKKRLQAGHTELKAGVDITRPVNALQAIAVEVFSQELRRRTAEEVIWLSLRTPTESHSATLGEKLTAVSTGLQELSREPREPGACLARLRDLYDLSGSALSELSPSDELRQVQDIHEEWGRYRR